MRTTITLDDDVAAKLTELSRKTGQSFKAVVNTTLRQGLNAKRAMKPAERFRVKARALGLRPGASYDNIGELLDEIEHKP